MKFSRAAVFACLVAAASAVTLHINCGGQTFSAGRTVWYGDGEYADILKGTTAKVVKTTEVVPDVGNLGLMWNSLRSGTKKSGWNARYVLDTPVDEDFLLTFFFADLKKANKRFGIKVNGKSAVKKLKLKKVTDGTPYVGSRSPACLLGAILASAGSLQCPRATNECHSTCAKKPKPAIHRDK